jgi:hypothetical protein
MSGQQRFVAHLAPSVRLRRLPAGGFFTASVTIDPQAA